MVRKRAWTYCAWCRVRNGCCDVWPGSSANVAVAGLLSMQGNHFDSLRHDLTVHMRLQLDS